MSFEKLGLSLIIIGALLAVPTHINNVILTGAVVSSLKHLAFRIINNSFLESKKLPHCHAGKQN